ncbi:hypothetical protein AB0E75_19685 [Streptomyces griseoviridis]|uniref:DUF308 domain-containing protein n=3 Tax=Streptomyces TaxID=1883 RepID=A0A918G7R8_STRGD|nr:MULTISPECIES: hypothetical protein [Streptomyces]MDP9681309.1 hypothetical protein [Streptomyces griseoviridis]GGS21840.1 hypothetical protein GCM10010238_07810 [Streptomyces niveoruber]GGS75587.1 hypothetical protein GCM10010240_05860 [Streptomyces griseoviridis]GGU37150.1 hypothetical protein GCM10010259_29560 [Streptomyces daghestanicus]GHI34690.1 hypothetical protein Sdagh_64200 [Streptomyces daghestanicus]
MAEHDSDREDREERGERGERGEREGTGSGVPQEQHVPFDEDAAWAAIVAGYGEEPPDPPGAKPFKSVEDLALLEPETNGTDDGGAAKPPEEPAPAKPLGSSVAFAPGIGPRDHGLAEPAEDDLGADDEGHFVPPEPPPLPQGDTTARFAWLGVLGGPLLLLVAVLLGWDMTWWLTTLCIGGFLGGFATLVTRMRTDDEEDDDPGRGAVV